MYIRHLTATNMQNLGSVASTKHNSHTQPKAAPSIQGSNLRPLNEVVNDELQKIDAVFQKNYQEFMHRQTKKISDEFQVSSAKLTSSENELDQYKKDLNRILVNHVYSGAKLHAMVNKKDAYDKSLAAIKSSINEYREIQSLLKKQHDDYQQQVKDWENKNLAQQQKLTQQIQAKMQSYERYLKAQAELAALKTNYPIKNSLDASGTKAYTMAFIQWEEKYVKDAKFDKKSYDEKGDFKCIPSVTLPSIQKDIDVLSRRANTPLKLAKFSFIQHDSKAHVDQVSQLRSLRDEYALAAVALIKEHNSSQEAFEKQCKEAELTLKKEMETLTKDIETEEKAILASLDTEAREIENELKKFNDYIDRTKIEYPIRTVNFVTLRDDSPIKTFVALHNSITHKKDNIKPKSDDHLKSLYAKADELGLDKKHSFENFEKNKKAKVEAVAKEIQEKCAILSDAKVLIKPCETAIAQAQLIDLLHSLIKNNIGIWNEQVSNSRWVNNLTILDIKDNIRKPVPTAIALIYSDLTAGDGTRKTFTKIKNHQDIIKKRLESWVLNRRGLTDQVYKIIVKLPLDSLTEKDVNEARDALSKIEIGKGKVKRKFDLSPVAKLEVPTLLDVDRRRMIHASR